jgi:uncharacterized membrane protein YeaQ/YmgE (transglycosylase-associated protein family)
LFNRENPAMPFIFIAIVLGCAVGFAARFVVTLLVRALHLKKIQPPGPLFTTALGIAGALLAQLVGRVSGVLAPPHLASLFGMTLGAIIMMSLWYLVMAIFRD